jgi:hypothetical protein
MTYCRLLVRSMADRSGKADGITDFASLKWPHFDHYIWPHPNR